MAQAEHLEESSALASRIQEELASATGVGQRGVKQAPFRVLVGAAMPAVLVEVAFISNPEEEKLLASDAFQAKVASAIAKGISRYDGELARRAEGLQRLRGGGAPALRNHAPTGSPSSGSSGCSWPGLLTAPRWSRFFRRPLQAEAPDEPIGGGPGAAEGPQPVGRGPANDQREALLRVRRHPGTGPRGAGIPFSSDLATQIRTVVEGWSRRSQHGPGAHAAARHKVLEVFVTAPRRRLRGPVEAEASQTLAGGSDTELLTVYSVVNSITTNFPSITRVQILVDNHPAETLAGHVDLSRPLPPDMTLLAAAALTPVEGPAAEAGGPSPAPLPERPAPATGQGSGR